MNFSVVAEAARTRAGRASGTAPRPASPIPLSSVRRFMQHFSFCRHPGTQTECQSGDQANLFERGKPFGGRRPAWPRSPSQSRRFGFGPRLFAQPPGQPVGQAEHLCIRQPAVLVALQDHAGAARHLRHLVQREDQQLAVVADDRDVVALGRHAKRRLLARAQVQHLLAGALLGQQVPRPARRSRGRPWRRPGSFAPRPATNSATTSSSLVSSASRRTGWPSPRPRGRSAGLQRVGAAVGAEQRQPVGGLAGQQQLAACRLP